MGREGRELYFGTTAALNVNSDVGVVALGAVGGGVFVGGCGLGSVVDVSFGIVVGVVGGISVVVTISMVVLVLYTAGT